MGWGPAMAHKDEILAEALKLPAAERAEVAAQLLESIDEDAAMPAATQTTGVGSDLGRRLRAARERIVASGEALLDLDEVAAEVARRRGGARQ